ncbi:MAG: SpoIIE family protein phosphatase [Anaerolineales bacterium]
MRNNDRSTASELTDLQTLNRIVERLNKSVDVQSALEGALGELVDLMGLQAGWLFLRDPSSRRRRYGQGFRLAAHHNLPPAMALAADEPWLGGCDCQAMCLRGELDQAYNEVRCSRLGSVEGDKAGLTVHASAPLRSGGRQLGILNVAGQDWESFSPRALALLTNAGAQIGIALERTQLYDRLHSRRIAEQDALLHLSRRLLERADIDGVLEALIAACQSLLAVDASGLILAAEAPNEWTLRLTRGWHHPPPAEGISLDGQGDGFIHRSLSTGKAIFLDGLDQGGGFAVPTPMRGENFHAAACVPLASERGILGGLLVAHRQPFEFDKSDRRFLRLAASQAALVLEKNRLDRGERARHRLEEELVVAREIQRSLLPEREPQMDGWAVAAAYRAASQVSGDFFDFLDISDPSEGLGIVVADVMGKGVPAALFMAMARTTIRSTALSGRSPAHALLRSHELILKDSRTDRFLTVFYGVLEPDSGRLTYCNAGHNPPLWFRRTAGRIEELTTDGIVLGAVDEITLGERTIQMAPGDILLLYTDGFTEAIDDAGTPFGLEGLSAVLETCHRLPAREIADAVMAAIDDFRGTAEQLDDLTLVVVERKRDR